MFELHPLMEWAFPIAEMYNQKERNCYSTLHMRKQGNTTVNTSVRINKCQKWLTEMSAGRHREWVMRTACETKGSGETRSDPAQSEAGVSGRSTILATLGDLSLGVQSIAPLSYNFLTEAWNFNFYVKFLNFLKLGCGEGKLINKTI